MRARRPGPGGNDGGDATILGQVRHLAERFAPRILWRHRIRTWHISTEEPEQELLPWACDRRQLSLDVGAAQGTYLAHLLLYSAGVIAFEPRPEAAGRLRAQFGGTAHTRLEQVALSDASGTAEIRIPAQRPMRGTIAPSNLLQGAREVQSHTVPCARLDDYRLAPVGFIKIDVEGHERAVLAGARDTVGRNRPIALVEAEERHSAGSVAGVARFFQEFDCNGYFLLEGRLRPIAEFDAAAHQDSSHLSDGRRTGVYINNFLFVPHTKLQRIPGHYLSR
ncbi:MAG TPA: FkbM family methyltransferase [Steroidobacteraceae bacterium]